MWPLSGQGARIELFGLIAGLCLMAGVLRFDIDADGAVRYRMLQMLVDEHQISASKYSIVQPVAALPLYVLGKLVGQPLRLVARFNLCVFSLMLLVVYRRLSARTETSVLRHWCLLMLACSMYLYHLRMFFTEVLSAAAVVVGLTCLVTDAPLAGSFALCLAVINSPTLLPALALVALKLAWDKRKPWYLVLPAVSVLAILLDAWIRRGSPLSTGYETELSFKTIMPYSGSPGFTYPFVLGVLSCLFSFGKGLLFFAPGLFLLPATIEEEPLRRLYGLLLLFVAGMVGLYAKWSGWYGGWFWGPRYFLLASVPASLAIALCLRERNASALKNFLVLCALVLSAWVGIDGAVFGLDGLSGIGTANNYALEGLTWYVPEFSPLWHPFIDHRHLAPRDLIVVAYCVIVAVLFAIPLIRRLGTQAYALVTVRSDSSRTP
jgi:hypothetical protein